MEIKSRMAAACVVSALDNTASTAITKSVTEGSTQGEFQSYDSQKNVSSKASSSKANSVQMNNNQKDVQNEEQESKERLELDTEKISQLTEALNKVMEKLNCNLQFHYNQEVDVMSVKMVNKKTGEIIKEYPPEEMVQNLVKAKEWIGAFLDEEA